MAPFKKPTPIRRGTGRVRSVLKCTCKKLQESLDEKYKIENNADSMELLEEKGEALLEEMKGPKARSKWRPFSPD
jgi:hypothetical protein